MAELIADPAPLLAAPLGRGRSRFGKLREKLGIVLMLVLVALAIFGPLLTPLSPIKISQDVLAAPSWQHPFGTDNFGRDVLSRWISGARPLVVVGWVSAIAATAIGTLLGVCAAAIGKGPATVIMRVVDVMLAFPSLLLALALVAALGNGLTSVTIGIAVAHIPQVARMAYGLARSVLTSGYAEEAYHSGSSMFDLLRRHVVPNIASSILVFATSIVGWAMLAAATLNFLGFGTNPPTPDWGADLSLGSQYLYQAWWMSVFPGIGVTAAILAANFLGDTAARRLDVRRGSSRRWRRRTRQERQRRGDGS